MRERERERENFLPSREFWELHSGHRLGSKLPYSLGRGLKNKDIAKGNNEWEETKRLHRSLIFQGRTQQRIKILDEHGNNL